VNGQPLRKYIDEFRRRAAQGKCYHRPALGVREFAADFEGIEDLAAMSLADWPEEDLGLMLYDVFDPHKREEGFKWLDGDQLDVVPSSGGQSARRWEGRILKPEAVFFRGVVRGSCVDCHPDRISLVGGTIGKGGVVACCCKPFTT
jgi:CRISPR-associated protein Cas5d